MIICRQMIYCYEKIDGVDDVSKRCDDVNGDKMSIHFHWNDELML